MKVNPIKAILSFEPSKAQTEVLDHHICYGITKPLCGQPLGKKGLSRNKSFTTCPECKILIRKK
jgi:hypothetical protein